MSALPTPKPAVSMRELLEAGVHFGHQTRRWNPKMRRFIFTERAGIYIIDLQKTLALVEEAHELVREIASRGGSVLFVGTKKQARDAVANEAKRANMPYVNFRWLGGLLTNFRTISDRIAYLHELRRLQADGQLDLLPAKERMQKLADLEKLEANLGGVAEMRRLPQAVFVIDLKNETLAVREARRLGLPVIGLVDTNCDPDEADHVIPGNDDGIRACELISRVIADGVIEGRGPITTEEDLAAAAAAELESAEAGEQAPDANAAPPAASNASTPVPVADPQTPAAAPSVPDAPIAGPEPTRTGVPPEAPASAPPVTDAPTAPPEATRTAAPTAVDDVPDAPVVAEEASATDAPDAPVQQTSPTGAEAASGSGPALADQAAATVAGAAEAAGAVVERIPTGSDERPSDATDETADTTPDSSKA